MQSAEKAEGLDNMTSRLESPPAAAAPAGKTGAETYRPAAAFELAGLDRPYRQRWLLPLAAARLAGIIALWHPDEAEELLRSVCWKGDDIAVVQQDRGIGD